MFEGDERARLLSLLLLLHKKLGGGDEAISPMQALINHTGITLELQCKRYRKVWLISAHAY